MYFNKALSGLLLAELGQLAFGAQSLYGQCGGNAWSGETSCGSGACCSSMNPWYHQCQTGNCSPKTSSTPGNSSPTTTSSSGGAGPTTGSTSSGCGKSAGISSGTHTVTVNGQQRQYILTIPQGYDSSKSYKLIYGLHWLGGTMNDVVSGNYYSIEPLANGSAVFVAPQGLDNGWANSNGQDITLMDDIRTTIEDALCIDKTQVYSMGWSYGGSMSYALACARPDVFRAVAVMSGANLSGCSPGTQPVAYYAQHGVNDNVLPIALGRAIRDTFVKDDGCTPQNPPEPASGSGTHIKTEYSGCSAGHPVWWIAFDGPHEPLATDAGASSPWTPGQIWSFFSQFF